MIPEPRSEFVGRNVELDSIAALLDSSRLVTLTGVGGVGKTRLAIRAANARTQQRDEPAWFVPLETVVEPALLPLAMVRALGLTDQSAREPLEVIVEALAERDVLMVLDNCEHLIEAAAQTADRLLDALPRLRILATSRRPLELVGEHIYPVPPLSLADDEGRSSDALRLLDARARAAGASGLVSPLDELAASRLVRALDGLPLAIELAATRLRTLPINDLVDRVSSRFTLLRTGPRNAVERQRTLRAVVDWSYGLCTQPQRELWAALSVFSSPFDLDAAVAMAGLPAEAVVDILDQLVAQSVVEADHETGRFRMLETIRQYGRERADEGGRWPVIVRRHVDYVRETAARIRLGWWGPEQAEKLARLRDERAELEAALVALEAEDPDEALDLFSDLRYHWAVGGFLREGRAWAGRLLGPSVPASPRRIPALITAAWLGLLQGDTAEADELLTAAESLLDTAAEVPVGVGESARIELPRWRGTRAMFLGDPEQAQASFARSIAAASDQGMPAESLLAQFQLTTARSHLRRADAAEPAAEALAHAELIGETWMRSHALWALALAAFVSGDLVTAESYARRALTVEQAFDDPVGMCLMLEVLSWTEARRGGDERAAVLLGAATTQWQRIGSAITVHGPQLAAHHDECVENLRRRLGARSFTKLFDEGAKFGPREALALALRPLSEPAGMLSAREREVASGIHRGLSNREIGDELVLSVRTIDTHVQRIFTKLDVASRAQVAAWYESQGSNATSD